MNPLFIALGILGGFVSASASIRAGEEKRRQKYQEAIDTEIERKQAAISAQQQQNARLRDYAEVKAKGEINLDVAKASLEKLGIDEIGLDEMDRKILRVIIEQFSGGPVGLKSLAVAVGEDSTTIEDVYEPFLIKEGMIMRTSRGRLAQDSAYDLLGIKKTKDQQRLFNDK